MYLVLTALLALNVSAEILNAFNTVNNSLGTANGIIDQKNKQIFNSLQEQLKDASTKERAEKWAPLADQAGKLANDEISYIEGVKMDLLNASGYDPATKYYREDELEGPTRIMVEESKGDELFKKLTDFKKNLLAIDPEIAKEYATTLPIDLSVPKSDNSANTDWKTSYFHMVPTVAALTILSKFENDIKNSEAMVVDFCQRQVGAVKMVFDSYKPIVGQSSNYLMPGQELTITAGIGAFNSAAKPTVTIDGANVPLTDSGVAVYKTTVSGSGSKMVHISYFNQISGKTESQDFPVQFTVGSPTGASISADKVQVLYIGLENELTISGGSVGDEKVHASVDNGQLIKSAGAGKYVARPTKTGTATITLNIDGKGAQTFTFRVKQVPDPHAMVGASPGGRMSVNDFKAQAGVRADLGDFIFEGVKFTVTGYTVYMTGAGFNPPQARQASGNTFNDIRDLIDKVKPGTTVVLDEIRASGPSGVVKLAPVVYNLF